MRRAWARWGSFVIAGGLLVGCGGSAKRAPAEPAAAATGGEPANEAEMVSPEAYDDVRAAFRQREMQVGRCFADAARSGSIDAKAGGRVTVALKVTPAGEPRDVRVASISTQSPQLEACIVKLVSSWSLPPPNTLMDFSYTYSFLAE